MGKHHACTAHLLRVLFLAAPLGGCAAASGPERRTDPVAPAPLQGEFRAPEPFRLSLTAAGPFRPGEPVQLTLRATSTYASSEATVSLTLMEVAAGEDCGWAAEIRIPTEEAIRPHVQVRKPLVAGETVEETVTIRIPEAGYYGVRVVGFRPSEPPMVPNVSSREYGLLIKEDGGRLTTGFLTSLIPAGMRREPGPFTPETALPRIRFVNAGQGCVAGTPA